MGLALTACDGYKEPNPPAQYNPQESILQTSEVAVEGLLGSETYDLNILSENKENIEVAEISCDKLPSGYTFGAYAYISADNFETSTPVAVEVAPAGTPDLWKVCMNPDSLQVAYNDGISKEEEAIKLGIRLLATTITGDQVAIVGGLTNFYGPYSFTILPMPPAVIEMEGPFLWTPGDANGWNQEASQKLFYFRDNFVGFAMLSPGGFKFTDAPDWNNTNYGAGDGEGLLSTDGGAANLEVPASGLYWCSVNTEELTYSVTPISQVGIIGDACEYGWDASVPLTTTNNLVWTGDVYLLGGGFKFRCNDAWDINLGGTAYNYLLPDGDNLQSPGEGEYTVTLDLSRLPYSCTLTKK